MSAGSDGGAVARASERAPERDVDEGLAGVLAAERIGRDRARALQVHLRSSRVCSILCQLRSDINLRRATSGRTGERPPSASWLNSALQASAATTALPVLHRTCKADRLPAGAPYAWPSSSLALTCALYFVAAAGARGGCRRHDRGGWQGFFDL